MDYRTHQQYVTYFKNLQNDLTLLELHLSKPRQTTGLLLRTRYGKDILKQISKMNNIDGTDEVYEFKD